ncbi:RICIN domain-containing protein [Nonomuraea sp. NPDC050451]|uniref:RICIN domain-containing protein n=1 Tax=Nonomuraea sp. NPDC050451 TaxID=3364364 RepID=UPI00378B8C50
MRRSAPTQRALFGTAAAAVLTLGLFSPPAFATTAGTSGATAGESKTAALLFNIQNYQTKQCVHLYGEVMGANCHFNSTYMLFQHGSANSIRHYGMEDTHYPIHYCLDANGDGDEQPVKINPCNGGNYQKWTRYSDGHVKNWATKKCLDIKSESPFIVYARKCMPDNQWQKWAFK